MLQRHLAVGSREDALRLVRLDRNFWNVVSIFGTRIPKAILPGASKVLYCPFDDIENPQDDGAAVGAGILRQVFEFADATKPGALAVHCQMGISRSTAVCFLIIARELNRKKVPDVIEQSTSILHRIRPQANPNVLVLARGLELFLPPAVAAAAARKVHQDSRFSRNHAVD
jgi:predicted protein tyrosine phosphatase